MKKTLPLIAACLFTISAVAQNDTLIYEGFDVDPNGAQFTVGAPNGNDDPQWINLDEDGIADGNAASREQFWFHSTGAFVAPDTGNGCMFSSSWLAGFAPGNRNWMITPSIPIVDANATLSWRACPRQSPTYLDGYTVLVSTTDNLETSFTDTLYSAAQYVSGTGNDFSAYVFTPAGSEIHGIDPVTFAVDTNLLAFDTDSASWVGRMKQQSVSLAAYSGMTIHVAFLHDSDDDNLIAVDDILVMGTASSVGKEELELGFTTYPNPATDLVTIDFNLPVTTNATVEVYSISGELVNVISSGTLIKGAHSLKYDVSNLAAGTYSLNLVTSNGTVTKQLVVN